MNNNSKSVYGFTKEEVDFMAKEYIYNHKGYRAIAKMMGKNEIIVRKQIALTVSELVA